MTSGNKHAKKLSQEESQECQLKAVFLYWPMTMAEIVNENDNVWQ